MVDGGNQVSHYQSGKYIKARRGGQNDDCGNRLMLKTSLQTHCQLITGTYDYTEKYLQKVYIHELLYTHVIPCLVS